MLYLDDFLLKSLFVLVEIRTLEFRHEDTNTNLINVNVNLSNSSHASRTAFAEIRK